MSNRPKRNKSNINYYNEYDSLPFMSVPNDPRRKGEKQKDVSINLMLEGYKQS